MGYNATVVVMVDALHDIRRDTSFSERLAQAITNVSAFHKPLDVSAMNHINAATVIETHHADRLVPVLVGGNTGLKIDMYLPISWNNGNPEEALLRSLAEKLGYRLSKKPATKSK